MDKMKRHLVWWGAGILVAVAAIAWWMLRPAGIPEGFAASNGRIEATEVDIATKIAGRIDTILVSEGQFVRQGEVLAKMDTRVLQEQRLEAIAQIKEAESAVAAARALLEQRQSEMRAARWTCAVPRCGAGRSVIGWRPGVEHGRSQRCLYDIFPADRTGGVVEDRR